MKIIFADNSEIEVKTIFGSPCRVQNADRDMLTIEVDPTVANTEGLRTVFMDKSKTSRIRTQDELGQISEVGEDYTIYISSTNERREVVHAPGSINPPEWEEINIVKIAQLTYMEKLVESLMK